MPMLVRNNYARNIFRIMREFKLTPASPDFYNMTSDQLEFMVTSLNLDYKEEEMQSKGMREDSFSYDPNFNWEGDMDFGGKKDDEADIKRLLGSEAYNKRNSILEDVLNNLDAYKERSERTKKEIDAMEKEHNDGLVNNNIHYQPDTDEVDEI